MLFPNTFSLILGFIISEDGIQVDPAKIQSVINWPSPMNTHEVRSFHGFATFYQRFIKNFSTITTPITDCLKKGKFVWVTKQENSLQILKKKLSNASVLAHPNFGKAFEVETDASATGIGADLCRVDSPLHISAKS